VVVSHHPLRDRRAHESNERGYAYGLGAWAGKAWREGDLLPSRYWWTAFRRTVFLLVSRAPFDGPRWTRQRGAVAWFMMVGWLRGARLRRALGGKDAA
jgi:hypothetical protein